MGGDGSIFLSIVKLFVALPVVLILAYISLKLGNNYMLKASMGRNMKIVERISLSNKSSLNIIKVGEKYYLIGASENNTQILKELSSEEIKEYDNNQLISSKFNLNLLKNFKEKGYK